MVVHAWDTQTGASTVTNLEYYKKYEATLWSDTNQVNLMNWIPDLETTGEQLNSSCIQSKAEFSKGEKHEMGCGINDMFDWCSIKSRSAWTDNNWTEWSDPGNVRRKIHCNCCTNITNNSVSTALPQIIDLFHGSNIDMNHVSLVFTLPFLTKMALWKRSILKEEKALQQIEIQVRKIKNVKKKTKKKRTNKRKLLIIK